MSANRLMTTTIQLLMLFFAYMMIIRPMVVSYRMYRHDKRIVEKRKKALIKKGVLKKRK